MPEATPLSGIPRQRISIDATDRQFLAWAFEEHAAACRECAHGDAYCPAGRALLAATAPAGDPDLPGYQMRASAPGFSPVVKARA